MWLNILKGVDDYMKHITNYKPKDFAELLNVSVKALQEEWVQDIISILHVFSCRIYGLRKYKKKIKEDEEIAKSIQGGIEANETTNTET